MRLWRKRSTLEYEFLPAALEITETPPSPFGHIVVWFVTALLCGALVWSYCGRIDEIAVARGKIIPDGNVKIIQPVSGGVISALKVSEGEHVTQGEIIAELDATLATADVASVQQSLETAKLERDIYKTTLAGKDASSLIRNSNLPADTKEDLLQVAKTKASVAKYKRQFLDLNVQQAKDQLNTEQHNLATVQANLDAAIALQQQLQAAVDAATAAGQTPDTTQLTAQKSQVASLQAAATSQQQRVANAQAAVDSAKSQSSSSSASDNESLTSAILGQDQKIDSLESDLLKAQHSVQLQSIVAPVDGTVLSISSTTIGGVVTAAQPFITIVPTGTPFVVEASLLNKDVGFVAVGQEVAVKVDAFSFQRYGYMAGTVKSISADAFDDQTLGAVYKMRISLSDSKTTKGNALRIGSGMAVSAEVKTGQRRIINFFLDPLVTKTQDGLRVR